MCSALKGSKGLAWDGTAGRFLSRAAYAISKVVRAALLLIAAGYIVLGVQYVICEYMGVGGGQSEIRNTACACPWKPWHIYISNFKLSGAGRGGERCLVSRFAPRR